jgi:hypothetical protein
MSSWLRLTLVTVTVGGGFAGFAATFVSLFNNPEEGLLALLLRIAFLGLYAYVTISGLMFVHDPRLTRHLAIALALQIPWISSPLALYLFTAGPAAIIGVGSPTKPRSFFTIEWKLFLAGTWRFSMFQGDRWGMGINLFAMAILMLLCKSVRADSRRGPLDEQPTAVVPESMSPET